MDGVCSTNGGEEGRPRHRWVGNIKMDLREVVTAPLPSNYRLLFFHHCGLQLSRHNMEEWKYIFVHSESRQQIEGHLYVFVSLRERPINAHM
jgi:hypothetical protein